MKSGFVFAASLLVSFFLTETALAALPVLICQDGIGSQIIIQDVGQEALIDGKSYKVASFNITGPAAQKRLFSVYPNNFTQAPGYLQLDNETKAVRSIIIDLSTMRSSKTFDGVVKDNTLTITSKNPSISEDNAWVFEKCYPAV
ncbi:MAG: hypothetical protein KC505_05330 [Myxococcales bacterium]|nr:hypothetical protein [Myxococcales bacterium]USN51510.1 MAG: hypothetical protein H6731_03645 [Myxococcales bacterium]